MGFNVNKVSGIVDSAKAKITSKASKATQNVAAEVSETVSNVANKTVNNVSPSEALRAQVLADFQYAPNADFLGYDKDAIAINETLKYADLPRIKEMIKSGRIYHDCSKHEAPIADACRKYGIDKVLAEVNAGLEKSHIINDSGLSHKSAAHASRAFDDSETAKLARTNYELTKQQTDKPIH